MQATTSHDGRGRSASWWGVVIPRDGRTEVENEIQCTRRGSRQRGGTRTGREEGGGGTGRWLRLRLGLVGRARRHLARRRTRVERARRCLRHHLTRAERARRLARTRPTRVGWARRFVRTRPTRVGWARRRVRTRSTRVGWARRFARTRPTRVERARRVVRARFTRSGVTSITLLRLRAGVEGAGGGLGRVLEPGAQGSRRVTAYASPCLRLVVAADPVRPVRVDGAGGGSRPAGPVTVMGRSVPGRIVSPPDSFSIAAQPIDPRFCTSCKP